MEPSQDSEHASDTSTQKCGNCNQEKPIDAFVSRTKTKRPTRWCIDCRISGCEVRKRLPGMFCYRSHATDNLTLGSQALGGKEIPG